MGPVIPVIAKIRDRYLREIYLKIGRDKDIGRIKQAVAQSIRELNGEKDFKKTGIIIDVDPI